MSTLRLEIGRAFTNKWFVASLVVLTMLAIAQALPRGINDGDILNRIIYPHLNTKYYAQTVYSIPNAWIALDHVTLSTELFFFLAPFLVLMGYSWSLATDLKSGYCTQLAMRATRSRYYGAKAAATFLAGGTLVAVPLLVNLLVLACFVPFGAPSVVDAFYVGVSDSSAFVGLLFFHPAAYIATRLLLDFALCGLWATTVLALSCFVQNRVALIALPYIFLLLVKHLGQRLYVIARTNGMKGFGTSVTLFDQLRAEGDAFFCPLWVTLICIGIMLAISIALPLLARRKDIL